MKLALLSLAVHAALLPCACAQLATAPLPPLEPMQLALPRVAATAPMSVTLQGPRNLFYGAVPIAETVVYKHGTSSLQVDFDRVDLPRGCVIELVSFTDGDRQFLTAEDLDEGRIHSAHFNGPALRVRLWAAPGAKPSVRIASMTMGLTPALAPQTICGRVDKRKFSTRRPVCRLLIQKGSSTFLCTGWLVSKKSGGHVTAGHCLDRATRVTAQYRVPRSTSTGAIRNPPAADQYVWRRNTRVFSNRGVGNDWGVFRTIGNPFTRQKSFFRLASPTRNLFVRRHGYGSATGAKNFSQKVHTGRLASVGSRSIRYRIDSTGGDSGGPVSYGTNIAVGIHSHGGCTATGGSNAGTNVNLAAFRAAYRRVR